MKLRDFWTSKPRKRHDGRQGEGCRSSKENKKNVGSRWRGEVRRRLGCGRGGDKGWDFPHDQRLAYPQNGRHRKNQVELRFRGTNSLRPIWRVLLHTKSLQQRFHPFSSFEMGLKRTHDEASQGPSQPHQKKRKGFSVGPANLPDGTYRRKSKSAGFLGPKAKLTVSQPKR